MSLTMFHITNTNYDQGISERQYNSSCNLNTPRSIYLTAINKIVFFLLSKAPRRTKLRPYFWNTLSRVDIIETCTTLANKLL